MNFIPKSARSETAKFIEEPIDEFSLTYGTYDKKQLEIEYGMPVDVSEGGEFTFMDSSKFSAVITMMW